VEELLQYDVYNGTIRHCVAIELATIKINVRKEDGLRENLRALRRRDTHTTAKDQ
jgi:hypothetical protein